MNATDARGNPPRLLIISPWETVWSLGRENDIKAGVSDDDRFIDGFTRAGYELHFLRPRSQRTDPRVITHTYPNFFHATRDLPVASRRGLWPTLFNSMVVPRAMAREVARYAHQELRSDKESRRKMYETLGMDLDDTVR